MPYKTLIEGAQILQKIGEVVAADGSRVADEYKSVIYDAPGTILEDSEVAPVVQRAYDSKDPHIRKLLRKLTKAQADKLSAPDVDDDDEDTEE